MTTRILRAQDGKITDEFLQVAKNEGISPKYLCEAVAKGQIVILKNRLRKTLSPVAIGAGLKTKICMPLITNSDEASLEFETDKFRVSQTAGINCVMDLSISPYIKQVRHMLLSNSEVPVILNPFCELAYEASFDKFGLINISSTDMLNVVKKYCKEGVDAISLDCSITKSLVEQFKSQGRLSKITSRSAQVLFDWIDKTELENPYYKYFDEVLKILKKYDAVLHLSCAYKAGSMSDSFDSLQVAEYAIVAELIRRAHKEGVQVMSDGFGHIPVDKISSLMKFIKEVTFRVPMFLTSAHACDCAIGYDNISSAIAYSVASAHGADLLNVTSCSDYLTCASATNIKEGIVSAKIAANCGDLAKNNSDAIKQNYKISFARTNSNWKNMVKNSIDKSVFEGVELIKH